MMNSVPFQPSGIRQRVPLIGQQPNQQQHEQMARMQLMQAINDMAVGMYVQLSTAHIAALDREMDQDVDAVQLRRLAKMCMTAAKAFFEGLGVIECHANDN